MGTTAFVWDPVFDCVTHELDENNDVKAVYHNEPQQYGGVLSQRRGSTSHYHHYDALGSTRFLTDSSGNVTDTYLYDAWGNNVASTGTTVNSFKWVGKYGYYTDDSTGQVYVRARMYQPTTARWMTLDPMVMLYAIAEYIMADDQPTQWTDASGLYTQIENSDRKYACGPDVTSWFKRLLTSMKTQIANRLPWYPFPGTSTPYQTFWENLKFEDVLTDSIISLEWCPCGGCKGSIMLCGKCVDRSELGNIAAGFLGKEFHGAPISPGMTEHPPYLALYGALRIAGGGDRGINSIEDMLGFMVGLQLNSGSDICAATDQGRRLSAIDIVRQLREHNSSLLIGGGLDKWNQNVGARMTPPKTWEQFIFEAFDRVNRNTIDNPSGLGAERAHCVPCGVTIDGLGLTIAADGSPVWTGTFKPVT